MIERIPKYVWHSGVRPLHLSEYPPIRALKRVDDAGDLYHRNPATVASIAEFQAGNHARDSCANCSDRLLSVALLADFRLGNIHSRNQRLGVGSASDCGDPLAAYVT